MKEPIKIRSRLNNSLQPTQRVIYIEDVLFIALFSYALTFFVLAYSGLSIAGLPAGEHLLYWLAYSINLLSPVVLDGPATRYYNYMGQMAEHRQFHLIALPFITGFLGGFAGSVLALRKFVTPIGGNIHVRGSKLHEGVEGFNELKPVMDNECKQNPMPVPSMALAVAKGEDILNIKNFKRAIWIATARKITHFLIVGSTRTGKSQILKRLARQAINNGFKCVFLDKKGEYTSEIKDRHAIIIGYHDARQWEWAAAKDIQFTADAYTFFQGIITVSDKDPYWGNSAIAICVGLMTYLINTNPRKWTLGDFGRLTNLPQEDIIKIIKEHYPPALGIVSTEGQAYASVMGNIAAYTTCLKDFAKVWDEGDYPEFSVLEWLDNPKPKRRNLILKSSGRYAATNDPMMRGILSFMGRYIDSDQFPDDTPENPRNLHFWLDEFSSFGKMTFVEGLLERGASKGVTVCIACQDLSQLQTAYSEQFVKFLVSNNGNLIVTGAQKGETAKMISEMVGDYSFEKLHISKTAQVDSNNQTINYQEHTAKLITPDELSSKLGAKDGQIRFLYLGSRLDDVFILHQPIIKFPKVSQPLVPASWMSPIEREIALDEAKSGKILPGALGGISHAEPHRAEELSTDIDDGPDFVGKEEFDPSMDGVPDTIDSQEVALRVEKNQKTYTLPGESEGVTPGTFVAPLVSEAIGLHGAEHLLDLAEGLTAPNKKQTTSKKLHIQTMDEYK